MVRDLLNRMRFYSHVRGRQSVAAARLSRYSEAELAGWMPLPLAMEPHMELREPKAKPGSDAEALVARFYCCQEC